MRANEFAFVLIWTFMPFVGIFYPIESLPFWAQKISNFLPMSYIFTGMRQYVFNGINPMPYIIKSNLMNIAYGALSLIFFFYMFNRSKDKGLARLTD
jgi:ABC-2 type transport system permease protein